jgi:hypothetical protein
MTRIDYVRATPKMGDPRHVAAALGFYRVFVAFPRTPKPKRRNQIMNARALLLVPAAVFVAVLSGCGQTDGGSLTERGSGSVQFRLPSTEICSMPDYVRKHAPAGVCVDPVDDVVSPVTGR